MRVRSAPSRRTLTSVVLASFILGILVLGNAGAASAADSGPLSPAQGAYFGSIIDWSGDSTSDQTDRLGSASAVYEHSASVPFATGDNSNLAGFFAQTRQAGALGVVTLKPTIALASIDARTASAVAEGLSAAAGSSDAALYVRFAPDMNSTWLAWGQQPSDFKSAFRFVADAVHALLPNAVMVWSPAWGGGYPFTSPRAATTDTLRELDTNSDGVVDAADDAYAPYYPGDDVVDWVGLSFYHDDTGGGSAVNTVARANEFTDGIGAGLSGDPSTGFYATYSAQPGHPFLLETGAFFSPSVGGADELGAKQAWWRQVFEAVDSGAYPELKVILWRDTTATRAVTGEAAIDWSVSLNAATRASFTADLAASTLRLGPVVSPSGNAASASAGATITGAWAWLISGLVVAAVTVLFVWALRGSFRSRQRLSYSGPANRDLRIDLFRGVAIVFVVVNHVGMVSVFQDLSQETIGVVSGAELFVLLSGVVLAMVYRPKLVSGGIGEVVLRTGRRAWKLYYTALAVVLLIYAISLIPAVSAGYVTSFTDQGTGALGGSASGRVYALYAGADQLLAYPVNPQIIVDILMLRLGPWQFNVMGLYVVLLAVSPVVLWALSRRKWMLVLAVSVGLYLIGAVTHFRLLPSQFEDSFPLLIWQVLFVSGIVAGFYRRELIRWFSRRTGLVVLAVVVGAATLLMLLSWNNPYLASSLDARLALIPDNVFRALYADFFQRTFLESGRLVNVIVLVLAVYALLTAYWLPISKVTGWFLIPLGQSTLYVFIMHVFFALIASNIPVLNAGNAWLNSAAYVVMLGLLWVMVKTRFLFSIVPR